MNNILRNIGMVLLVSLLAVGCAQDDSGVLSDTPTDLSLAKSKGLEGIGGSDIAALTLPSGAVINEAKLRFYCISTNDMPFVIHAYPQAWDENTVTWNEINAAIDVTTAPVLYGPFTPTAASYFELDITAQVKDWITGPANFGLLLRQDGTDTDFNYFASSEWSTVAQRPALVITYNGTETAVVQRLTSGEVFDAHAMAGAYADQNFGSSHYFSTGRTPTYKYSLIKFDLSVEVAGGCTRTIGYWKTHAGFGPQADDVTPLLPIWLGNGLNKSRLVSTAGDAVDYLKQNVYGNPKNGITKLYSQMLGAKLNLASGAGGAAILSVLAAADGFLETHDFNDWGSLSKAEQAVVLGWAESLGIYNNGLLGVDHCD